MANPCDAMVIGAGDHGLRCAAALARAGRSVLVLAQERSVGVSGTSASSSSRPVG